MVGKRRLLRERELFAQFLDEYHGGTPGTLLGDVDRAREWVADLLDTDKVLLREYLQIVADLIYNVTTIRGGDFQTGGPND